MRYMPTIAAALLLAVVILLVWHQAALKREVGERPLILESSRVLEEQLLLEQLQRGQVSNAVAMLESSIDAEVRVLQGAPPNLSARAAMTVSNALKTVVQNRPKSTPQ
jgi:hypothetical protein